MAQAGLELVILVAEPLEQLKLRALCHQAQVASFVLCTGNMLYFQLYIL